MSNFKEIVLSAKPGTFFKGAGVLGAGFSYALRHKGILVLALLPIFIAAGGIFFGFSPLFKFYFSYVSEVLISGDSFNFFGGFIILWLAKLVLKLLVGFLSFLTFYIVLQIIYIPICSLLAEKVLSDKGILKQSTLTESISFGFRMFRAGLLKSVVLIAAGILCFVFSFVPLFNFLPIYFALMVLAYDSFDYGLELYGLSVKERMSFVRREFLVINGHIGVLFLLSFIPGILLLTLPFSVVGASVLIGEKNEFKK